MYRSIVVPLDGSLFGEHALPVALSIARQTGATVHLVHAHVVVLPVFTDGMPLEAADESLDSEERTGELAYLRGLAERLRASWEVPISVALLDAPIANALRGYAQKVGADLMVMATHGRGGLSRFWLGSVADELVRQAPVPLLLVRPHEEALDLLDLSRHEQTIKRILIPLDGSPLAEQALDHALALGGPMAAEYALLQAIDPMIINYSPAMQATGIDEQLLEHQRGEATEYLARVAARLTAQSLRVKTQVAYGPAALAVLEYARRHGIDMIAMATHGRNGFSRVLLGSVADKVVRGATMPVLLCRPKEAAPQTEAPGYRSSVPIVDDRR